jgi:hypothetical protein
MGESRADISDSVRVSRTEPTTTNPGRSGYFRLARRVECRPG